MKRIIRKEHLTPEQAAAYQKIREQVMKDLFAPPMNSYILSANLEVALRIAIETLTAKEKEMGYTGKSALLAGWEANLKDLLEKKLTIKYEA